MEAVPRISMISFPLRTCAEPVSFKSAIKSFIDENYEEDSVHYDNEIHQLETLRAAATHVTKDVTGCSTLKKYLCQLHFLKSRFPFNEGNPHLVGFSWYDYFGEKAHSTSDIDFEISCILYNIGALHSELGATDNRSDSDGMKTSCTHFQCAAWAFQHLKSNYCKFYTADVLSVMINVCLAQAQECILEKSLIDNKKSTITAKVALQIVEYYDNAMKIMQKYHPTMTQLEKIKHKWKRLIETKSLYYSCISHLYRGFQAEDEQKWGTRVTFFKASLHKLQEALKTAKSLSKTDAIHETLNFTLEVAVAKVDNSEKENEFIYHEKVPSIEELEGEIKPVSLVKGIPIKFDDPEVSGPDIFAKLVPIEAHELSSIYSEEQAKILRHYAAKVEEKNEALEKFMMSMQLEQLDIHEDRNSIPQELIDACAAMSVNTDAITKLKALMSQLNGIYIDVDTTLKALLESLETEELNEKEFQSIEKRSPNNLLIDLKREAMKYASAHAVASKTNEELKEALSIHITNLSTLMKPLKDISNSLPSYALSNEDEQLIQEIKRLVAKVNEMKEQRANFHSQLRESILNDDITKQIVIKKGQNLNDVFEEELSKHDKITKLLDQNLLAQENIVRALKEANNKYADVRKKSVQSCSQRQEAIQALLKSSCSYGDLSSKCNKGIDFYKKLETNVNKLNQRLKGVINVRNEEREQKIKSLSLKSNTMPTAFGSGIPAAYNVSNSYYNPGMVHSNPTSAHPKLKDYLNARSGGVSYGASNSANQSPAAVSSTIANPVPGMQVNSSPATSFGASSNLPPNGSQSQQVPYHSNFNGSLSSSYSTNPSVIPSQMPSSQGQSGGSAVSSASHAQYSFNQGNQSFYPSNPTVATGMSSIPQSVSPSSAVHNMEVRKSYTTVTGPGVAANVNPYYYYSSPQTTQMNYHYPSHSSSSTGASSYAAGTQNPYGISTSGSYNQNSAYNIASSSSNYANYGNATGGTTAPQNSSIATPVPQTSSISNPSPQTNSIATPTPQTYPYASSSQQPYPAASGYYTSYQSGGYGQVPGASGSNMYQYSFASQIKDNNMMNWTPSTGYYQTNTTGLPGSYGVQQQQQTPAYSLKPSVGSVPQYNQFAYNNTSSVQQSPSLGAVTPQMPQNVSRQQNQSGLQSSIGVTVQAVPQASNSTLNIPPGVVQNTSTSNNSISSNSHQYQPPQVPQVPQVPALPKSEPKRNIDLLSEIDLNAPAVVPLSPTVSEVRPNAEPKTQNNCVPKESKDNMKTEDQNLQLNLEKVRSAKLAVEKKANWFDNDEYIERITNESNTLEHCVSGFFKKSLNGPTNLDLKWKELIDLQNVEAQKSKISVARCYAMKNRYPDILPYDESRVPLPSTKDEYINASFLHSLSPNSTPFIATQLPMASTYSDFWHMIWLYQVETIVCLCSENDVKNALYWPSQKGSELIYGPFKLTLETSNARNNYVERVISMYNGDQRQNRVVVHLQFLEWGGHVFPSSPALLANFVNEVAGFFKHQRSSKHPVVTHCVSGVGKTGVFCVLSAAFEELNNGHGIPDLLQIAGKACQQRKGIMIDKEYLRYAYLCLLYYCQDILMKRGILSNKSTFDEKPKSAHIRHPSQDFLKEFTSLKNQLKGEVQKPTGNDEVKDTVQENIKSVKNTNVPEAVSEPFPFPINPKLTDLDVSTFINKSNQIEDKSSTKREAFEKARGSLLEQSKQSAIILDENDPLSSLDPLWPVKKH